MKDYFYIPFFLLIILWSFLGKLQQKILSAIALVRALVIQDKELILSELVQKTIFGGRTQTLFSGKKDIKTSFLQNVRTAPSSMNIPLPKSNLEFQFSSRPFISGALITFPLRAGVVLCTGRGRCFLLSSYFPIYPSYIILCMSYAYRVLTPPLPLGAGKAGRNNFEEVKYHPPFSPLRKASDIAKPYQL